MRRLGLVAGMLLVGSACAYKRAMIRGENNASSGDWQEAYEAYQVAVDKRPDEKEARRKYEEARDHLVDDAMVAAKTALSSQQFEAAVEQLVRAEHLDPDRPEVYALRQEAERIVAAAVAALWESGDARGSYAMAVRAQKMFPKAAYLGPTFDQLRGHFTRRAEALLKEKKFEYALVAIRTISEFEPDRKGAVTPIEQRILGGWADDCASRAASLASAKKTGAAAVMYARAYELAGRQGDLDKARAVAKSLASTGRFTIQLTVTGPPDRTTALRSQISAAVAKVTDTELVAASPVLAAKLVVPAAKCAETDNVTKSSVDYVSGQVTKPNPAHAQLAAELSKARADEKAAKTTTEKLWPQLQTADAGVAKFDAAVADLTKRQTDAAAQTDQAEQQLAAARGTRDEVDGQLERTPVGTDTKPLEAQLVQLDARVKEWSTAVAQRQAAEDAVSAKLQNITAQRAPVLDARDRMKAAYERATQDRTTAQSLASDLTVKLASTPTTVTEDVHAVFRYDVHDWTRTCTATVSASMSPRWKSGLPTAKTFAPANQVNDRSHVGFAKARLEPDPKVFATGDGELVSRGDAETAGAVGTWLGALADDWYHVHLADTARELASDPVAGTTPLVALFVGAHDRLDAEALAAFQAHVSAQFGLQKLDLLGSTPPP